MESEEAEERGTSRGVRSSSSFVLIGNIPGRFHSSDLRAFFSQFIERKGFLCFHFRHRPELLATCNANVADGSSAQESPQSEAKEESGERGSRSSCCVAAVTKGLENELSRLYQNKNWTSPDGDLLRARVKISRVAVSRSKTKGGEREAGTHTQPPSSQAPIPWDELRALPELNPPCVMPQGNVGTPLATFIALIRDCKLPPRVIKKLRLEFPKSRSRRRYGAVGLDYGTDIVTGSSAVEEEERCTGRSGKDSPHIRRDSPQPAAEEDSIPPDDDHDAEEWERFEALHDDVDKQERTRERLFEEELEVVWDKGSSGLVFYTDASYWDQQEGDFDEKCSQEDDWDVDMAGYYDNAGGDMDARDLRRMGEERRLREGKGTEEIGTFEKHTTGIGSRILKRSGWSEGAGVGASNQGIPEPVDAEGQPPHSKRGFGYRGEKLESQHAVPPSKRRRPRASRDVIISTVYDKPQEEESTVHRTAPARTIKYRHSVRFQSAGTLKDNHQNSEHKQNTD